MNEVNKKKGFTIIEVVLVLAIAGLIFLVVFLAVPALQRGQRDNQRRADLGRMISQVVTWQSNKQGALPTSAEWNTTFKTGYLTNNQQFKDPSTGNDYTITEQATLPTTPLGPTSNPGAENMWIYKSAACGGTNGVQSNTGSRNFAAIVYQEQGGFTCQSNQ